MNHHLGPRPLVRATIEVRLLSALRDARRPLTLGELCGLTGGHTTTVESLLSRLVDTDVVTRDIAKSHRQDRHALCAVWFIRDQSERRVRSHILDSETDLLRLERDYLRGLLKQMETE